jgi:hypothetical protein
MDQSFSSLSASPNVLSYSSLSIQIMNDDTTDVSNFMENYTTSSVTICLKYKKDQYTTLISSRIFFGSVRFGLDENFFGSVRSGLTVLRNGSVRFDSVRNFFEPVRFGFTKTRTDPITDRA